MEINQPSVAHVLEAAIEGPCALTLRDPRDGRPAYLSIEATVEGYAVRLETGYDDDGTASLREVRSIEAAAALHNRHLTGLLRSGYRPMTLHRGAARAA